MSTYKIIPVSFYDIPAIEGWLSENAAKGWFLVRFRRSFAEFEKGEPQTARYRIEPAVAKNRKAAEEQRDALEQGGWNFITPYRNYFHVYASADDAAEEPHTDPAVQSLTYDAVCRRSGSAAAFFVIATLAILSILIAGYAISDWPVLLAVESTFTVQLLLILVYILLAIRLLEESSGYRRLKKQLKIGFPPDRENTRKKSSLPALILNLAALALAALTCALVLKTLSGGRTRDIPTAQQTGSIPDFILLEDMERPGLKLGGSLAGADLNNTITYNWSFLAPVSCQVSQSGTYTDRTWESSSLEYSPSLQIRYYELRYTWLSVPLLEDLLYRYAEHALYGASLTRQDRDIPGLKRAVTLSDGAGTSFLFACSGRKVIMMQYYGEENLEDQLPAVADQLKIPTTSG